MWRIKYRLGGIIRIIVCVPSIQVVKEPCHPLGEIAEWIEKVLMLLGIVGILWAWVAVSESRTVLVKARVLAILVKARWLTMTSAMIMPCEILAA